jgi:transglutaminase-like putative cysteine protease
VRRFDGWRLRTDHETVFTYSSPARSSYNEARPIPLTTTSQTTLDARVQTAPLAQQYSYLDYWGTHVVAFNVGAPHDRLSVVGSSLVETHLPAERPTCTWSEIDASSDRLTEYLAPSRFTSPSVQLTDVACTLRTASPVDTVEAVVAWVYRSLKYVRGVTHVHTSAEEAFAAGSGVCQDFAHLALAVLRAGGIPARYVSGYLHPDPEARVGSSATGESHAWIEAWAGGWWGLDPTNDIEIGLRHVVVARGRDYADVPPVKGIYAGLADHAAKVTVTITRVA